MIARLSNGVEIFRKTIGDRAFYFVHGVICLDMASALKVARGEKR